MAKQVKHKTSFFESKAYNNFMAKVYGIGAAIVIVGALFKIQHYPMANIFLPVGLGMEAIIFFFSAFQKPHVEPDWSLVYPQFLGKFHTKKELNQMIASGKITQEFLDSGKQSHLPTQAGHTGGGGNSSQVLDGLFEKAQIPEEVIKQFGKGMEQFASQAKNLNDITEATVATKAYADSLKKASHSAEKLNESLSAINAVYELQLKESNQHKAATAQISKSVNSMIENIQASQEATQSYQKEMNLLTNRISSLNKVYGNMLTAMNVK